MRKTTLVTLSLATLLAAGCRVKETRDEQGNTKYEAEPAKVEVGTDTATVKLPGVDTTKVRVPTVQVAPDTTPTR
ncbi:MAG TPA: hypothetical protein VF021_00105 [Longimicrobiales bacterium]